jgi:hypothetical protein
VLDKGLLPNENDESQKRIHQLGYDVNVTPLSFLILRSVGVENQPTQKRRRRLKVVLEALR